MPSRRRPAPRPSHDQLELDLQIAPSVRVVRRPGGVVELHPQAPRLEGTVTEAARVLGVSPRTLRTMITEGIVRAWKPRSHWRVCMASVYALRARRETETRPDEEG